MSCDSGPPNPAQKLSVKDDVDSCEDEIYFVSRQLGDSFCQGFLSKVTICDTFATESLFNPVRLGVKDTFPGAAAHSMLLVKGTATTVAILLLLSGSPCTTTTGRR
jgi:hypothetical protein